MISLKLYTVVSNGRIFPKIQPTTLCQIELTLDNNPDKSQWRSGLNKKQRPFSKLSTLENPCKDSLISIIYEFKFLELYYFCSAGFFQSRDVKLGQFEYLSWEYHQNNITFRPIVPFQPLLELIPKLRYFDIRFCKTL